MKHTTLLLATLSAVLTIHAQVNYDSVAHRTGIEAYFPLNQNVIYHYTLSESGIQDSPKEFTMQYIGARTIGGGGEIRAAFIFKGITIPSGDRVVVDTVVFEVTPDRLHRTSDLTIEDEVILKNGNGEQLMWSKEAGYQKLLHTYSYQQAAAKDAAWEGRSLDDAIRVSVSEEIDGSKTGGEKRTLDYFFVFAKDVGIVKLKTKTAAIYQLDHIEKLN